MNIREHWIEVHNLKLVAEKLSQYLDVYDDSDFLDYVDNFHAMHKVDVPVGRYTSCTANINTK
jgi:hypothetical protein